MGITPAQQRVIDMSMSGMSTREIAKELGVSHQSVGRLISRGKKWLDMDPAVGGILSSMGVKNLESLHSGWVFPDDADGKKIGSLYFQIDKDDQIMVPEEIAESIREHLNEITPATATPPTLVEREDGVALFCISDWHFGAYVSSEKAGREYNPDIAKRTMHDAFSEAYHAIPSSTTAIILYNGDTTHANDDKDATPRSGHRLKVKGSHHSNILAVIDVIITQIELLLKKHTNILFSIKPGNHDPNAPTYIAPTIEAYYRNEPRVKVEKTEGDFFVFQKNRLFLVAHHGHGIKPAQMALTIPHKFRDLFGKSDFHYFFTGHYHSEKSSTFGGLHWRQLPSMCYAEQYSAEMGFVDTAGMFSAHYDSKTGRRTEFVTHL